MCRVRCLDYLWRIRISSYVYYWREDSQHLEYYTHDAHNLRENCDLVHGLAWVLGHDVVHFKNSV